MMLPVLSKVNTWLPRWVIGLLVFSMFAIPVSSTLKSISLSLSLVTILMVPQYRNDLYRLRTMPWCVALMVLFLWVMIAVFWSPAPWRDVLWVLEKYTKLLYLPILAVGFQQPHARQYGIYAFLVAMLVTALFSIVKSYEWFGCRDIFSGAVFRNHIMTSMMMALAAYLSLWQGLQVAKYQLGWRILYLGLFLLFSFQLLFINGGRMGYIIYLGLMLLWIVQHVSWRQAVGAIGLLCVLFGFFAYNSPVMKARIAAGVTDWKHYQQHDNKDTALGYRLQFHQYAYDLWKRHPVIGNGTASFSYLYDQERPVASWQKLLEPHSQYWLMAAELGLLGVLIYGVWMFCLGMACFKLCRMRALAVALLFLFMIGNLSDSLLFYSGSGYFFIIFMALCLGEMDVFKKEIMV